MSNRNDNTIKKMMKTGAVISLCAVLAGGLAVNGFNMNGRDVSAAEAKTATLYYAKADSEDKSTRNTGNLDVTDVVEDVMPSIVSITTKSIQEVQNYYGMFGFGGYAPYEEREVQGGGSGIIISKNDTELLMVTNAHVVEGADTLSVTFIDNQTYEGKVKGYDEEADVAIVAVKLDDISDDTLNEIALAKIGSSDALQVGEQVAVMGNAMGYGQSVTTGIVSAKNRHYDDKMFDYEGNLEDEGIDLIQTDAAINPGNSGGAIVNMDGEVVGIASSKLADTVVEGMCYAIAISDVTEELEGLMNEETRDQLGDDEHGILGIVGGTVSEEESKKYGFPVGVFVSEVTDDGPADEAGIHRNSIITKFNNKKLDSIQMLIEYLSYYAPGEEVTLTVATQRDGEFETEEVVVKLGAQDASYDDDDDDKDDRDDRDDRDDADEPDDIDKDDKDDKDDDVEERDDDEWDFYDDEDEDDPELSDGDDEDDRPEKRSREDIFKDWENSIFGEEED